MSFCVINSKNFKHNIDLVTQKIELDKIGFVIKNNAYGHGLIEMAKLAHNNGIKNAIVISIDEAELIRDFFDTILVLADIPKIKSSNNIHITINELDSISKIPEGSSVELKVDTGMRRNGVLVSQVSKALNQIDSRGLVLKGVYTHFADSFNDSFLSEQKMEFDTIRKVIENNFNYSSIRFHCSSSSGVFKFNNNAYDMARIGIALYGYINSPDKIDLKPILSLWANKISTRQLAKGDKVGYGGSFISNKKMKISTYDIGYGDGFIRIDENKKQAEIKDGRRIIGRVSMNNLAVEGEDQEICLFDDVTRLAEIHKTIPYEILCRIRSNIKKKVI
ncbi:MAG: alanine racemase [Pelagibacteraceae bacterium TMED237]|nr:alanine racemase [Candidatus Neomarinimicrobiota bacterium]OUW96610.1 MAG: alanine racemase [Pelagibacteraceae bacterium TMED237]|tara:strand:- start:5444 stop:6445 length:1002 start_codon:yes stop_codon:yes gene_type:complete